MKVENPKSAVAIPTLATDRLSLVPLSFAHSDGMFALWSDPLVCEYSGEVQDAAGNALPMPAAQVAVSDRIIDFWITAAEQGWGFRWAVLLVGSETFTGTLGFNALAPCAELAYHQLPEHWGQGYMGEAAAVSLTWVQQAYQATAVDAFIEPANAASVALVKRLGFVATAEFSAGAQRFLRPFPQ